MSEDSGSQGANFPARVVSLFRTDVGSRRLGFGENPGDGAERNCGWTGRLFSL